MYKRFFILFVILITSYTSLSACNCAFREETLKQKTTREFYYSDLIFLGKVIAITELEKSKPAYKKATNSPVKYTFEITEIIKGRKTLTTVDVYSNWSPTSCGYIFELGQKYLVHSKRTINYRDYISGMWANTTSQCIGNTPRRRTEKTRLDQLRKLESTG